jgi:hypothetical protein
MCDEPSVGVLDAVLVLIRALNQVVAAASSSA